MTDSIVVPLDGTVRSEAALSVALAISDRTGGPIRLVRVHAVAPTLHPTLGVDARVHWHREDRRARGAARAHLDERAAALLEGPDPRDIAPLFVDDAATVSGGIMAAAEEAGASLIVMTPREEVHGSEADHRISDALIRDAALPVLLIPRKAVPQSRWRPAHLLVSVPSNGVSRNGVVAQAARVATAFDADLTLLSVLQPARTATDVHRRRQEDLLPQGQRVAKALADVASTIGSRRRVNTRIAVARSREREAIWVAEQIGANLILLSSADYLRSRALITGVWTCVWTPG